MSHDTTQKKNNLWHILGFHRFMNCIPVDFQGNIPMNDDFIEKRYTPQVFSPIVLIENRYKCLECGREFWYAPTNFFYAQLNEKTIELLKDNHP